VILTPCLTLACAGQNAEHERQTKELEYRVRQLSTKFDRLEERLLAVEAVERYRTKPATSSPSAASERPDLPTVKAGPTDVAPDNPPQADRSNADVPSDDSHRLMIVGEGTRIETRDSGDARALPAGGTSTKATTRAAKRSPSSVPTTGTSSSGANP
jgi:hypothetical protein